MAPIRRRVVTVAVAVLVLLGIAGVASASIPGGDGTIHGCYKNSTGMLIAIDSAASCPTGYTALNWSQTGPQGPAGATGPQGPAGPAGASGYQLVVAEFAVPANQPTTAAVACPSGKAAVGGGFTSAGTSNRDIVVTDSAPQSISSWIVAIRNWGATDSSGQVFAVCLTLGS
jgi:hypothetical protein